MSPKVLLVVLILLVVLFVAGIGLGAARDDPEGEVKPQETPLAWLEGILAGKQALSADDVTFASPGTCRDQLRRKRFELDEDAACSLTVGESSEAVRSLVLSAEPGGTPKVVFTPREEGGVTVDRKLAARETLRLTIREEGARLRIECTSGSQCVLGVK